MDRVCIQGSDGYLVVDARNGSILERKAGNMGEGALGYPYISHFDRNTLTESHMDILECGYWDVDGNYEAPDEDFMGRELEV